MDSPDWVHFGYRPRPEFLATARRARLLGRGVTVAWRSFKPLGGGSNPSGPIRADAKLSREMGRDVLVARRALIRRAAWFKSTAPYLQSRKGNQAGEALAKPNQQVGIG